MGKSKKNNHIRVKNIQPIKLRPGMLVNLFFKSLPQQDKVIIEEVHLYQEPSENYIFWEGMGYAPMNEIERAEQITPQ